MNIENVLLLYEDSNKQQAKANQQAANVKPLNELKTMVENILGGGELNVDEFTKKLNDVQKQYASLEGVMNKIKGVNFNQLQNLLVQEKNNQTDANTQKEQDAQKAQTDQQNADAQSKTETAQKWQQDNEEAFNAINAILQNIGGKPVEKAQSGEQNTEQNAGATQPAGGQQNAK